MTTYYPEMHDKPLRHLFQCQLSDKEIAQRLNLHWQTVRRNRERLGLGLPRKGYQTGKPDEPLPPAAHEPTNPVVVARNTLGRRVTERQGTYFLDGNPISAPDLVRAANRQRVRERMPQFGPPQWRVP